MILSGKTVIVTGVGDGLGRECATSAYNQGANVVLAARTLEKVQKIAAEIDPSGERVLAVSTDITDPESCKALAEAAVARFGAIHGLAQVAAYEMAWGGLNDMNPEDWRKANETNVIGAYNVLRPLAPLMKEAGGGSVVFIGSMSMFKPSLTQAGYAASKAALLTATYYLADELGPDNIRVNMVIPSWMWGPPVEMYMGMIADTEKITPKEAYDNIAGKFPMRRMAEDGEVAETVTFFLSEMASGITGQHLQVNCGELSK
ncbi:MAG TPA: SDR family oxidoreductase [Marmoricola sp.]|nr:SDR family oxidoreductase [Marmoricola sp.]